MSDITEEEIARAIFASHAFQPVSGPWVEGSNRVAQQHARDAARAVLAIIQPALERARRAERERCAKVAESHGDTWTNSRCVETALQEAAADIQASSIAAAIRKG